MSLISLTAIAQEDRKEKKEETSLEEQYTIRTTKVRDSIFAFTGKGGNIGVSIGKDGAFLIDDQFAEGTPAILNAVSNITNSPVQFLINTHFHHDHVGGNKNMREAGVIIYAHENVRQRLIDAYVQEKRQALEAKAEKRAGKILKDGGDLTKAKEHLQRLIEEIPDGIDELILPTITFPDQLSFYYNDQTILVFHVDNAHTDGDVMVYFTESNVLHTGDAFINGGYPFIDAENGGSYDGYLAGLEKVLSLIDDETKIIPGHGSIATKVDVRYAYSMLKYITTQAAYHYIDGKTEDEVVAMKEITEEFDNKGFGKGFISTEAIVRGAYKEATKKYKKNVRNRN